MLRLLYFLVVAFSAGQAQAQEFRFSWNEFPELSEILTPDNLSEYLMPHETDWVYGSTEAPVTIVEFFSYACPHCKEFHEGSYRQLFETYVETGQVQIIKREFLLNNRSVGFELLAGAGAQCFKNNEQNQAFAELMFNEQLNLRSATDARVSLLPIFEEVGLSNSETIKCMSDQRNLSIIFGRSLRAIDIADVRGTPTLFINGTKFDGDWRDFSQLSISIDRALSLQTAEL